MSSRISSAKRKQVSVPGRPVDFVSLGDNGQTTINFTDASKTTLSLWPVETPDVQFGPLKGLVSSWRGFAEGEALPRRKKVSFAGLRGWHRHIAISSFDGTEDDPFFLIVGEEMAQDHSRPISKKRFSELTETAHHAAFAQHFGRLRSEGLIGYCWGNMTQEGREHVRFMVVELPLLDENGEVNFLLHGFLTNVRKPFEEF